MALLSRSRLRRVFPVKQIISCTENVQRRNLCGMAERLKSAVGPKRGRGKQARGRLTAQASSDAPRDGINKLEAAIGRVVRAFRKEGGFSVAELAALARLSPGMLSKIENGAISPSLATLQAVARALQVPVTSLLRDFEEVSDTTFVRAGEGLLVTREGPRIGHEYRILGHTTAKRIALEPYLMSYDDPAEVFPVYQRSGSEFIYVLEGELTYRHGSKLFSMLAGDSLLFDAAVPHGPEKLSKPPVRYIAVVCYARDPER
jgi:transcriptional regulator with XRE-family HTH domain